MSHKKEERNRIIVEYLRVNPKADLTELGLVFGITKQRVSKIRVDARKKE